MNVPCLSIPAALWGKLPWGFRQIVYFDEPTDDYRLTGSAFLRFTSWPARTGSFLPPLRNPAPSARGGQASHPGRRARHAPRPPVKARPHPRALGTPAPADWSEVRREATARAAAPARVAASERDLRAKRRRANGRGTAAPPSLPALVRTDRASGADVTGRGRGSAERAGGSMIPSDVTCQQTRP
jgi:hypothetical protein